MATIIGSARIDERGKASGGKAGDQKQTSTPDYKGEVSMQDFYVDSRGWYVLRAKSDSVANGIASYMKKYCNDKHVGYNQDKRSDIMEYDGKSNTSCDCSSLIRRCVKDASGKDPGNFTTSNEKFVLLATALFNDMGKYVAGMTLYDGDILVTCVKGHTVAVVDGADRGSNPSPSKTTVTYASHLDNGDWLSPVKGASTGNDRYSGVYGKPIDCFMVKLSRGSVSYRAHSCVSNKWYSSVTGYNKNDAKNGYAGEKSKDIDAIAIKATGIDGKLKYRVHEIGGSWLPWVTGYNTKDSSNGYAGNIGKRIDGIQITVV